MAYGQRHFNSRNVVSSILAKDVGFIFRYTFSILIVLFIKYITIESICLLVCPILVTNFCTNYHLFIILPNFILNYPYISKTRFVPYIY